MPNHTEEAVYIYIQPGQLAKKKHNFGSRNAEREGGRRDGGHEEGKYGRKVTEGEEKMRNTSSLWLKQNLSVPDLEHWSL